MTHLVAEIDRHQGRGRQSRPCRSNTRREIIVMLDRTRNYVTPAHHTMHVPRTMFAAAIDRFGGPDVLTAHALPVPAVDAGEVLIAVDTAGVGRWDADVREGYFASDYPLPKEQPVRWLRAKTKQARVQDLSTNCRCLLKTSRKDMDISSWSDCSSR